MNNYYFVLIFFISVCCSAQSNLSWLSNQYNTFFTEVDGELWIASAGKGYNRYRGIDTKHYKLNDASGLTGTYIQSPMIKDMQGHIWTSTYENLCIFDRKKDQFYSFQITINDDTIKTGYKVFYYEKETNLIYARANDQLVTIDAASRSIVQNLGPTKGTTFSVHGDKIMASPWHIDKGIEIWEKQGKQWTRSHEYFSSCTPFKDMLVTNCFYAKGTWWLLTTRGLVEYDAKNPCLSRLYTFHTTPSNNSITDGYQKGNYIYAVSDKNGVQVFDLNQKKFISYKNQVSEKVDYLYVDHKDRIWKSNLKFGTEVVPLSKYRDETLTFKKGRWAAIVLHGDTKIFLDNDNGFVISDSKTDHRVHTSSASCPLPYINQIIPLDTDRLVISGSQDMGIYYIPTKKYSPLKLAHINGIQYLYLKDKQLAITSNNEVKTFDVNTWQKLDNPLLKPYQGTLQYTIYLSDSLHIYGGTSSHILIQSSKIITDIDVASYINEAIYLPQSRQIIIGTNNGLKIIDKDHKITDLFEHHPVLHNQACSELRYQDGFIYFGTEKHVGRINLLNKKVALADISNFSSRPAFAVNSHFLHFAGDHYARASLEEAFNFTATPVLELDFLKVRDSYRAVVPSMELASTENNLAWRYYIPDIYNPDGAIIQYKLKGIDNQWKTIKNGQNITFANLASGKYVLQVVGMNGLGAKTDVMEQHFTIASPWYKSWWFFILIASIMVLAAYNWYKIKLKKIDEQHATALQISNLQRSALQAQMNPHFIFNCLNSIQNFIMQNEKLEAMDYLTRFANLIRQNLEASTSSKILLSDEIEMLNNYITLERMRFGQKFDYTLDIDDNIDTYSTYLPPLLIQPFVENAILHGVSDIAHHGMIHIHISTLLNALQIVIKDNGGGIPDQHQNKDHKSLAMSITSKRLNYINTATDKSYNIKTTSSSLGTQVMIVVHLTDLQDNY